MSDSGSNRPQLVENAFRANISKMPDFIGIFGRFSHVFRQTIVRVRQNKNSKCAFAFFCLCHVETSLATFESQIDDQLQDDTVVYVLIFFLLLARQKDKSEADGS